MGVVVVLWLSWGRSSDDGGTVPLFYDRTDGRTETDGQTPTGGRTETGRETETNGQTKGETESN